MTGGPRANVPVAGIVLAGGRSRRFGSDKLAARLDGRPLLDLAIGGLAGVVDLVVVAGPATTDPATGDRSRAGARAMPAIATADGTPAPGTPVLRTTDPERDGGPVVGLAAALEAAASAGAVHALVVGGDMPSLRPVVLELLLERVRSGALAAVAMQDGLWRPLPVALAVEPALGAARDHLAGGGRDLFGFLRRLEPAVLDEAAWRPLDPGGATFRDVDRPADLVGPASTPRT